MKSFFIFAAVLCGVQPSQAEAPTNLPNTNQANQANQIVAEVNGITISKRELDDTLRRELGTESQYFTDSEQHDMSRRLLERLIDRQLLVSAAAAEKLIPSEADAYAYLNLSPSDDSPNRLRDLVAVTGRSEQETVAAIRDDLGVRRYLDAHVFPKAIVSDDEARRAYDAAPEQFAKPAEVRARQILIKLPPDANVETMELIRKRAEETLAIVRAEPDRFPDFVKRYSEGPTKNGGDLGFFTANQLSPAFSEVAFRLNPGEISGLVQTEFGFHIIKTEEKRLGGVPPFDQVRDAIKVALADLKKEKVLSEHVKKIRHDARILVYYN